jgi:hypothetical protein
MSKNNEKSVPIKTVTGSTANVKPSDVAYLETKMGWGPDHHTIHLKSGHTIETDSWNSPKSKLGL